MEAIAGIFDSRADAERALYGLRSAGLANDRIAFLTPGTSEEAIESAVPITDTEQPGRGKAMGGAVGGARAWLEWARWVQPSQVSWFRAWAL